MAKWRDLSDSDALPEKTRRWIGLLWYEAPVNPDQPRRRRQHVKRVTIKAPRVKKAKPRRTVEAVQGQYAPIYLACPTCGSSMIRQLNLWRCWNGHELAHFSGAHYTIEVVK